MKKVDLVFRTIGERTTNLALDLAIKYIQPDRIHRIEHIKPFWNAVNEMLKIKYDCDFVVFMDADCLILEDMQPFLQSNHFPYVDCFVLDKFRGQIHQGIHITRIDVVREMQQITPPENDERYVLRPESRLRSFALSKLKQTKSFKCFRIFHDYFQYYHHIFAKLALRELRSRIPEHRTELYLAEKFWQKNQHDLDYVIANYAVNYTRDRVREDAPLHQISKYIEKLPEIAEHEISKLSLSQQSELQLEEVAEQAKQQWTWQIHRFDDITELPKIGSKIFGIGLSRTGTKSLTSALLTLGFKAIHYPDDETTLRELTTGHYDLTVLKYFDAITDITVAAFYPQLDRQFPNSKFILTIRDKDDWLNSLEIHMLNRPGFSEPNDENPRFQTHMEMRRFLRGTVYGCYEFNRDRMAYIYDLHLQNVKDYFYNRPDDLLVFNICAGETWEQLCPFLGVDLVNYPFPYTTKESVLRSLLNAVAEPLTQEAS
jgi:hypothetical protein